MPINGSYTSVVVRGAAAAPVPFYETMPDANGLRVVYPECTGELPNAGDLLAMLSTRAFGTVALLAEVQNEETLRLRLFERGEPTDEYLAEPGYADGNDLPPSGGNAARLCTAFGIADAETVDELSALLRAGRYDDEYGYAVASDRHREIADLLGFPAASIGTDYGDIERGKMPEGLVDSGLRFVPATDPPRQYVVCRVSLDTTDGEIAARFSPDVIAFEEEFDRPAGFLALGTVRRVRARVSEGGGGEADFGTVGDEERLLETFVLWAAVVRSATEPASLRRLLNAAGWTAFETGTRRVLRSAA